MGFPQAPEHTINIESSWNIPCSQCKIQKSPAVHCDGSPTAANWFNWRAEWVETSGCLEGRKDIFPKLKASGTLKGLENGRCGLIYLEVYPDLRLYLFLRSNQATNHMMRGKWACRERMTQKACSSVTVMWTMLQGGSYKTSYLTVQLGALWQTVDSLTSKEYSKILGGTCLFAVLAAWLWDMWSRAGWYAFR